MDTRYFKVFVDNSQATQIYRLRRNQQPIKFTVITNKNNNEVK